uniref:Uncharacterized protein n=1 Tax=Anopheles melas TaxID=34690 RepID=A0A182THM1_9DIPT
MTMMMMMVVVVLNFNWGPIKKAPRSCPEKGGHFLMVSKLSPSSPHETIKIKPVWRVERIYQNIIIIIIIVIDIIISTNAGLSIGSINFQLINFDQRSGTASQNASGSSVVLADKDDSAFTCAGADGAKV